LAESFIPEKFIMYEYKTAKQRGDGYAIYIAAALDMSKETLSGLLGEQVVLLNKLIKA
jgi:hypothetical protein